MSDDQFARLRAVAPVLFRRYPICGISIGEGWMPDVLELSKSLEALADDAVSTDNEFAPVVDQIKEKFGTLRYYISHGTDEMYNLISATERATAHICEDCSAPGELRSGGWIRTLCDDCAK